MFGCCGVVVGVVGVGDGWLVIGCVLFFDGFGVGWIVVLCC